MAFLPHHIHGSSTRLEEICGVFNLAQIRQDALPHSLTERWNMRTRRTVSASFRYRLVPSSAQRRSSPPRSAAQKLCSLSRSTELQESSSRPQTAGISPAAAQKPAVQTHLWSQRGRAAGLTHRFAIISKQHQTTLGDKAGLVGSGELQRLTAGRWAVLQQGGAREGYFLQGGQFVIKPNSSNIYWGSMLQTGIWRPPLLIRIHQHTLNPSGCPHLSIKLRPGSRDFVVSSDPVVESLSWLLPVHL